MNILIVDDNSNNRIILQLFLEDYAVEYGDMDLSIDEAADGLEAVKMCRDKSFDIVFMDIMMPNMDGIEATKIIRQEDKKIMIIAVSAVDDSENKKSILNSGAEDYISKPVNYDIFISRMTNYKILVETRKHKKSNIGKINLFTDEIYKRHTKFIINSEDALSEFWEFFLLNARAKYDNLSDIVRTIFAIADAQVRLSLESSIYIEESDEIQYFTITNVDQMPLKVIELILKKSQLLCNYKIVDGKISFELEKKLLAEDNIIVKEEQVISKELIASPVVFNKSEKLEVFDYMEEEDLMDLEDYAGKLNSLMLIVGSGDVNEDEVTEIYTYLEKLASVIATYSEIYPISKALNELASDMSMHIDVFTQNSEALGPMCKAFSNDMSNWIEMSFHKGAPSADFMNDTIVVNCQTISSMLKMDEQSSSDEDFDDIFDF